MKKKLKAYATFGVFCAVFWLLVLTMLTGPILDMFAFILAAAIIILWRETIWKW